MHHDPENDRFILTPGDADLLGMQDVTECPTGQADELLAKLEVASAVIPRKILDRPDDDMKDMLLARRQAHIEHVRRCLGPFVTVAETDFDEFLRGL